MLKPMGVVRWDPRGRAGAVAVTPQRTFDMHAISDMADVVMDWAAYQNVGANVDNVEASRSQGTYDWRAYLQEEAEIAQEREAEREKSRSTKKPLARPPPPAPTHLYA